MGLTLVAAAQVAGDVTQTIADLQSQVANAKQMAATAKAAADNATSTAAAAQTTAQAQSTPIGQLQQFAAQYGSTAAAADAIHAQLQAGIDSMASRTSTLETNVAALQAWKSALTVTAKDAQFRATAIVAINATITLTFTWPTAWPDTTYVPVLTQSASPLTNVAWTKTTTGATCTAKVTGVAVAVGAMFAAVGLKVG